MPRTRIALIGDTRLEYGELTDAGAIAMELASWSQLEVGIRTVANSRNAWEVLDEAFGSVGITSWMTIRDEAPATYRDNGAETRMGDVLNIDELFSHDLVIVATRDRALRRFLADLPVHTYPGVRMMTLIDLHDGVVEDENLADLLRFDVLVGSDAAFSSITSIESPIAGSGIAAFESHLRGSNVRAAVSWGKHGAFRCVTPEDNLVTIPPHHAPATTSDAPWAAFVSAVAVGLVKRKEWSDIGREATRRFAIRAQAQRSSRT